MDGGNAGLVAAIGVLREGHWRAHRRWFPAPARRQAGPATGRPRLERRAKPRWEAPRQPLQARRWAYPRAGTRAQRAWRRRSKLRVARRGLQSAQLLAVPVEAPTISKRSLRTRRRQAADRRLGIAHGLLQMLAEASRVL